MRVLRFDSVGGASGDMILSTLVALGVQPEKLETMLSTLAMESFSLQVETTIDRGLSGTRVTVDIPEEHHPHRGLREISEIIVQADLPAPVEAMSLRVFERLAEAEATVHGTTPDRIHFHEVGAMDAIVDIVGSCAGLYLLNVDRVEIGPLPIGRGCTTCAHGELPLPVPAVAQLLQNFSCVQTEEPFELVTPTGAALLTAWAQDPTEHISNAPVVTCVGYGLGQRQLSGRANALRGMLLTDRDAGDDQAGTCLVLECNLDDTVPELLGSLCRQLLQQGALDVFTTPVQMKKQRPGTVLTVLANAADREAFVDAILRETTTFGIRSYNVERIMLMRRIETVATPYGSIRVKVGTWKGRDITRSPEHDDCVVAAESAGVSVRTVFEAAFCIANGQESEA